MRGKLVVAAACLSLCAFAAGARADLYRWVDSEGQVHVTDDRAQVPPGATVTVQPTRGKKPASAPAPTSAPSPAAASPAQPASKRSASRVLALEPQDGSRPGRVHVLHFEKASHEISLNVTLADRAQCEFKVDTGASLNTVPAWVVRELGIEIDDDTPRISLVGISGKPALVPLIVMPLVRVGDVAVENVEMAVLDTMSEGLLGMPFFNHFQVAIDPAQGELRLTEIDLSKVDGVYDGMNEAAWRQRFRQLHERLAMIQRAREKVPEESETIAANYLDKLDKLESAAQHELDELEDRAQAAGVPPGWR
ncbi:MAG TPA: aspartyl protease family protein [Myxococcota bacterium]|nr:aspartyl protease family protein [Myxococcota bacterium]